MRRPESEHCFRQKVRSTLCSPMLQVVLPALPGVCRGPRNFRPFEIGSDMYGVPGLEAMRLTSFPNCVVKKQLKFKGISAGACRPCPDPALKTD
jgi:hypothetical protein